MAVAIGIVSLDWLGLISDSREAAQKHDLNIVKGLHLDTPEFKEAFTAGLWDLWSPRAVFSAAGGARLWVLVWVAFAVWFLWFKTDLRAETRFGRVLFGSLILLPSIVGLGMVPGLIRDGFTLLADQGLSHPGVIGAAIAEAFATFAFGGVLGLVLLLCFGHLLRRRMDAD